MFLTGKVSLSDARLKFEADLYSHYIRESVKVKEEDFLLYLPVECLV